MFQVTDILVLSSSNRFFLSPLSRYYAAKAMAAMSHATDAVTNQHLETFHFTKMNDILGTWTVTLDKRFNGNERLTAAASTQEDLYVLEYQFLSVPWYHGILF